MWIFFDGNCLDILVLIPKLLKRCCRHWLPIMPGRYTKIGRWWKTFKKGKMIRFSYSYSTLSPEKNAKQHPSMLQWFQLQFIVLIFIGKLVLIFLQTLSNGVFQQLYYIICRWLLSAFCDTNTHFEFQEYVQNKQYGFKLFK